MKQTADHSSFTPSVPSSSFVSPGGEARIIAWLAQRGMLMRVVWLGYFPRRVAGALLRRMGIRKPARAAQADNHPFN